MFTARTEQHFATAAVADFAAIGLRQCSDCAVQLYSEKVNKSLDVFRKTLKNSKQLKKEGFEKEDFDPFITKASAFKRTMDEFVKKMEKKEKASHSASSDSYFAQSEEGTPENILKSYNELIAERNKILEKKANKKS